VEIDALVVQCVQHFFHVLVFCVSDLI